MLVTATNPVTPTPTPTPTQPPSGGPRIEYTLPGGVKFALRLIPGGTFTMGSPTTERNRSSDEGPYEGQYQVTLSAYYLGETEVTQALWQAVMGTNPSDPSTASDRPTR